MELHDRLRALSSQLGTQVFSDADGFRAALDDYLDEGSATVGDINLLVDAVRLDAFRRMIAMMDHGAEPGAAVAMAGDQLALDRGSEDSRRSRWACAALGYAVGRVDQGTVAGQLGGPPAPLATSPSHTSVLPTRPTPPPVVSPPVGGNDQPGRPSGPPRPAPPFGRPPVPSSPRPAPRRPGLVVVAVVVALLLVGGAGAFAWDTFRDDASDSVADAGPTDEAPSPADDGGSGGPTTDDNPDNGNGNGGGVEDAGLSDGTIVVGVKDTDNEGNETSRLATVDTSTGNEFSYLMQGSRDYLPTISPDRRSIAYLERDADNDQTPMLLDVESGETRDLFGAANPCESTARAAWSPTGNQLSVVCKLSDDERALVVVNADGSKVREIDSPVAPYSDPTWISDDMVVYMERADSGATSLWSVGLDGNRRRQLTSGSSYDSQPDWNQDRGLLLFSRHDTDKPFGDICTMTPEPGARTKCTKGELVGHPSWSPDGDSIIYTTVVDEEEGIEQLWRVPAADLPDLSGAQKVPAPGNPGPPAWGSR